MAMLVEEILDLEMEGPNLLGSSEWWDRQFAEEAGQRRDLNQERERIARQLSLWKQSLPSWLDVDTKSESSPLPHHVVGVTVSHTKHATIKLLILSLQWYHTSRILLYSRFLGRHPIASSRMAGEEDTRAFHAICSDAAQAVIDLLSMLDKHRLLQQVSSDIIHLLSLTTLFEGLSSSFLRHVHHANLLQPMTLFQVTQLWQTAPRSTSHSAAYGYESFPLLGLLPLLIEYSLKAVSCQIFKPLQIN